MFTRAIHKTEDKASTAPRSAHVVDVDLWLDKATSPSAVRAFTPRDGSYVPRHRKEPVES